MTKIEKLKQLQNDIEQYGEYLEKETYYPYDKVQKFSRMLKEIIKEYED